MFFRSGGCRRCYALVEGIRSMVLGYGTFKNLLTFPVYMLYGSSILPPATGLTESVSAYAYPYAMAYGRTYIASPSANHLWFLPALFTGSILFCLLEEKTRKGILSKIIALALLFAIAFLDSGCKPLTQLPWAVLCLMQGLDTLSFEPPKRILSLVGKASMEIYEYQMLFLFVFGIAFLRISHIAPQLDGWLLGFIPVSAGTTVFMVAESLAIAALITWIKTRRSQK